MEELRRIMAMYQDPAPQREGVREQTREAVNALLEAVQPYRKEVETT